MSFPQIPVSIYITTTTGIDNSQTPGSGNAFIWNALIQASGIQQVIMKEPSDVIYIMSGFRTFTVYSGLNT